jgi:hypothetical protein
MLENLYTFIHVHTAFLYTVVLRTPFFFIDLWSFNHLCSGFIIMVVLMRKVQRYRFAILTLLLVSYEVVEILFVYFAINVFRPEILPDQGTDIVIGWLGGSLGWVYVTRTFKIRQAATRLWLWDLVTGLAVAAGISLLWVASYSYRYDVKVFNSPIVNWWAFLWWTIGLTLAVLVGARLRRRLSSLAGSFLVTWILFFVCLLVFEFIGYYVVGIHEIRGGTSLIFGLIHGTTTLKIFYIAACPIALALQGLINILIAGRSSLFNHRKVLATTARQSQVGS